jgi:hypothetical protein
MFMFIVLFMLHEHEKDMNMDKDTRPGTNTFTERDMDIQKVLLPQYQLCDLISSEFTPQKTNSIIVFLEFSLLIAGER